MNLLYSFFDWIWGHYQGVSNYHIFIEFIVFVFGILSVWFAKRTNILVYPTGLIATVLSVYLLYIAGYVGDLLLNIYYSIMSIYGWYKWTAKDEQQEQLKISRTNTKEKWIGLLLFSLTAIIVWTVYKTFNMINLENPFPNYVDIFTSGLFFTGMWFMANKKIENWTLWIIADLISIPLYAYRGLGLLSLQFAVFTALAISAYYSWAKELKLQEEKEKIYR